MYPLLKRFTLAGIVAGILGWLSFGTALAGFAFFVLFASAGLVWRKDEPPVFSFALAFQWTFIMAGYLYTRAGGELKAEALIGNIDLALWLALGGLLSIAFGVRVGIGLLRRRLAARSSQGDDTALDVRALFWITVITYSVSWMVEISPMDIAFNAAQIIYSALSFREVLFCLLWLTILRRRAGYGYGWIAFVIAVVPRFTSRQSTFKELIFMLLVVALVEWKPWVRTVTQCRWNRRIVGAVSGVAVLLCVAGVIWEGAIKPVWRTLEFEGTPIEKLNAFAQVTEVTTREMEEEEGMRALVSRVSSITQFALVLDRVPSLIPHENGKLTRRLMMHILVPRFLYPEKENLGADSWLAETYAGLHIGEDTSVGIGYMAELYVDWSIWGMFPCLIGLGIFFGVAYGTIFLLAPSQPVASALVIVPFIGSFTTFEASLPKMLGGFILQAATLLVLARFLRVLTIPRQTKFLRIRKDEVTHQVQ